MDNTRRTWAEIDLTAIRHNVRNIKQLLAPQTSLMAVVKADAYGHGMVRVARTCLESGADSLAVATIDEAIRLREDGIDAPMMILGHMTEDDAAVAVAYNIDACVFTYAIALALSGAAVKKGKIAQIHIKVDTGMGRIGFSPEPASIETIKQIHRLPGIHIKGIFTHFATADVIDKSFAFEQRQIFDRFVDQLEQEGIIIPIKHISNSAGIMELSSAQYNMVRAGIITYGLYPSDEVNKEVLPLDPAMRLMSRITFLKTIPKGHSVSYGRTYITEKDTVVATVPIGYADGYSRLFSNRAWASIRGQKVPLIGRVCMDQCMFDVTKLEHVEEGDRVILFGRPSDLVTADDLANLIGTINYEIICSLSSRVPRIYIG